MTKNIIYLLTRGRKSEYQVHLAQETRIGRDVFKI